MIVLITFFTIFQMDSMEMDLDLDEVSQKTAPPSLPSQCVGVGPRQHPIAPGSSRRQNSGGGAAARGQCTGGCAKQWWPGASVRTRLVSLLLARDRLSGDRNSQIFPAEKSLVKTGVHIFRV